MHGLVAELGRDRFLCLLLKVSQGPDQQTGNDADGDAEGEVSKQHAEGGPKAAPRALARQRDRARIAAQFTARELEVLELLAEGLDTIAMSHRLGIAAHTIEWHVRHVIEKLQVHSKLQAVIAAARLGLIDVAQA